MDSVVSNHCRHSKLHAPGRRNDDRQRPVRHAAIRQSVRACSSARPKGLQLAAASAGTPEPLEGSSAVPALEEAGHRTGCRVRREGVLAVAVRAKKKSAAPPGDGESIEVEAGP